MKELLYISFIDYDDPHYLGVVKKVEGQLNAFRRQGYHVSHLKTQGRRLYINDEFLYSINGRYQWFIGVHRFLKTWFSKQKAHYHLAYIRKVYLTPLAYGWLKQLAAITDNVLLEVPTYPYQKEHTGSKAVLWADDLFIQLAKRKIHSIVTTQGYDEIFGVPTIKIRNGYDFSNMPVIKRQYVGELNMITVSNISARHGIDRIINAIAVYVKSEVDNKHAVRLQVVGVGEDLGALRKLTADLGLEGIVTFHGVCQGEALRKLYQEANIGVGSLSLHRKGLGFTSSLKNMEYCYFGLPVIIGNPDPDLSGQPFVLEFPNDESSIDLAQVIAWYLQLQPGPADIQQFGQQMYSWDKQIAAILNTLPSTNEAND